MKTARNLSHSDSPPHPAPLAHTKSLGSNIEHGKLLLPRTLGPLANVALSQSTLLEMLLIVHDHITIISADTSNISISKNLSQDELLATTMSALNRRSKGTVEALGRKRRGGFVQPDRVQDCEDRSTIASPMPRVVRRRIGIPRL